MIEEIRDIQTRAGEMETFIVHPDRNGPHPVVFLLMDAPGIREELYDMTRRLGTVGYYVVLPNLYYRAGKDTKYGPDVTTKGSAEQARMRAVRTKMTIPPVMDDIADLLAFTDTQKAAKQGPVGAHGYCMSGPYALAAAARYPDRVAAAASFHGGRLATDQLDSPHLLSPQMRGEIYVGVAGIDPHFLPEERRRLETALQTAGVRNTVEVYPDVKHGFAVYDTPVYDRTAAERHWQRLLKFFATNLSWP